MDFDAWQFLSSPGLPDAVGAALIAWLMLFQYFKGVRRGSVFFVWLQGAMHRIHDSFERRMEKALTTFEWMLHPQVARPGDQFSLPPGAKDAAAFDAALANPWGWPVLNFAMRIGFVYPTILLFFQWAILNESVRLGDLDVLPDTYSALIPLSILWVMCSILSLRALSYLRPAAQSDEVLGKVYWLEIALSLLGAFAFAFNFSFAAPLALAIAVIISGTFTYSAGAAGPLGGSLDDCLTFLTKRGYGVFARLLFLGLCLSFGTVTVAYGGRDETETQLIVIFLLILPAINILSDWIYLGFKLFIIQASFGPRGLGGPKLAIYSAMDFLFSPLIIFFSSCLFIIVCEFINSHYETNLISLIDVFNNPGDHFWLWLMFASPLISSLLYFFLISIPSLITWLPPALWGRVVDALDMEEDSDGRIKLISALLLSGMVVGTIAGMLLAFYLTGLAVWVGTGVVLSTYLDWLLVIQAAVAGWF